MTAIPVINDSVFWGDLQPVPWVQVRLESGSLPNMLLLAIKIGKHSIDVCGVRFAREGALVGVNFMGPQHLMQVRAEVLVSAAVQRAAGLLGEHDPRIGWVATEPERFDRQRGFDLRCPLFDPTRWVNPHWSFHGEADVHHERQGPRIACPFCQELFTEDQPPMWSGANLQWTHAQCWMGAHRAPIVDRKTG